MTPRQKLLIAGIATTGMAASLSAQTLLGTYEFIDNSLAVTDNDGADNITFSDFSFGSYLTNDQIWSDGDSSVNTTQDATLDYASLSRHEITGGGTTNAGTGDSFTNGNVFSFTITNNSGNSLELSSLTGLGMTSSITSNRYLNSRVFITLTPADTVADTVATWGEGNGGGANLDNIASLDGTDNGVGANQTGGLTIANGASLTLYMPWVATTGNGGTRHTEFVNIDDIQVYGTVVPEPSSYALLAGLSGLAFVMLRRRK